MSFITQEDLRKLSEADGRACLSIYMPTHRAGPEAQQNPIRLKNLINQAESKLIAYGLRTSEAKTILGPAMALVNADDFWREARDGLAIFASESLFYLYRLPSNVDEFLVLSNRFHLKPLVPMLENGHEFFLLCLSQNEVRLFRGEPYEIKEIPLTGMPKSLAEALQYDDPEKQQQFHTATSSPGGQGSRPAIYHGHGGGSEEEKENILRFCQHVDKGLQNYLQGEKAPLVLACVEYLYPIYCQANSYLHLADAHIEGNPESVGSDELHQRALTIVDPIFQQDFEAAVSRFNNLSSTDQTSSDIQQIVPAAHYGRIDTLFVTIDDHQWGRFDPDTNTITLQQNPQPQNVDLLDLATMQTLLNSGVVFPVEPSDSAELTPLAAIFRY